MIEVYVTSLSVAGADALRSWNSRRSSLLVRRGLGVARAVGLSESSKVVSEEPFIVLVSISARGRVAGFIGMLDLDKIRREVENKITVVADVLPDVDFFVEVKSI